ncbi:ABC transporter permease [Catelliglobosispora koreensis]|uniref:ABC transporter permease n=1 Tax=Catelliglobosispora koreensis TaxID=129052 RepID=UPI000379D71B|nr:ABC transporter permease [Catelliglobosispora koreensis]
MTGLLASTRAELLRLRKWPALWVMGGVGLALNILFGYVFDYLSYRGGSGSEITESLAPEQVLSGLLPAHVPVTTVQGMPMFGGVILLILGALTMGGGYGWGTWKTVFTQGPSRAAAYGGTLVALFTVVIVLVTAAFLLNFSTATLIALAESQPLAWPPATGIVRAFGSALLIYAMWTAAGALAGTLARSPALAVGLSMLWALAIENLLRGVANVLGPIEALANVLPGTAAGSLAGSLGATAFSEDGTPGVLTTLSGGPAALLLAAYTAAFAVAAGLLLIKRDTV